MSGRTSTASKSKYNAKTYDRTLITFKKGQLEQVKQHAQSKGYSLNSYINKLIKEDMGNDIKVD